MAQKKITLFKEGYNIGAKITDGDNTINWNNLTRDEQLDLIDCMIQMALFFNEHVKEECMENYVIVTWPDSQNFMDLDGFEENSILINDEEGIKECGPCAYLINRDWFDLNK